MSFNFGNAVVVEGGDTLDGVYLVFGRSQKDMATGRICILDQLNPVSVPESALRMATAEEEKAGRRLL